MISVRESSASHQERRRSPKRTTRRPRLGRWVRKPWTALEGRSLARFRTMERRFRDREAREERSGTRQHSVRNSRAARGAEAGIVVRNRLHRVLVKQWPITRWCGGIAQSSMVQRRYSPMTHASEPEKTVPTYHRTSSKRARIARASSRVNTSSPPNSFSTGCRFRWNMMNRDYMDVMLLGGTG